MRVGKLAGFPLVTDTFKAAVWLSVPAVPVSVAVADMTGAEVVAERDICWGVPGVRVRLAGFAVTPDGNPVTCTLTWAENPFSAVTDAETGIELPAGIETDVGFTANPKSGAAVTDTLRVAA